MSFATDYWDTIWRRNSDSETEPANDGLDTDTADGVCIVKVGTVYTHAKEVLESSVNVPETNRTLTPIPLQSSSGTKAEDTIPDGTIYRSLTGTHDIRVLELHAGRSEDELSGSLQICSVLFEYPIERVSVLGTEFRPRTLHATSCTSGLPVWYTALSYVWGNPKLVKAMICDGKNFPITENLELALRHLRRSDVPIMLWVDQICINQDDLQEKSQQVALMGTIYQRAWSTLVWLGEEADNSDDAIDTLLNTKTALQYYQDGSAPNADDFERLFLPSSDSPKWQDLGKLMRRPWFQRVWIIQEVVLSNQLIVLCGTKHISWADLALFSFCMVDNDFEQYLYSHKNSVGKDEDSDSGSIRTWKINRIKDYNDTSPRKTTFLDGLVEGRAAQATNSRDKVFAIMGLTNTQLYPDYSSEVIDVYSAAALKIEATPELGNLLCCVDHLQPTLDLPSWVPDWATPRQTVSLGYGTKFHKVYQASKELEMQSRTEMTGKNAGLAIMGVIVDTISNVGMVAEEADLRDVLLPESFTSRFVLEGMNLAMEFCQPYPSSTCTLFKAFWHTMVAGKDHSNLAKAPDEFGPIFALLFDTATGSSPSFPDQPAPPTKRRLTIENLQVRGPARAYRQMQVAVKAAVHRRRLGMTKQRYLGLFPRGTEVGDQVCVFAGGWVPFVIRRHQARDEYQLVGECYLHGIMDGEVDDMEELQKREIYLR